MFFLDLQTLRAGAEGWLVLDITAASDRWLLSRNRDLGLRLYVETLDGETRAQLGALAWAPVGGASRGPPHWGAASLSLFLSHPSCAHWEDSVGGE